jgi:hypothetical protein
MEFFLLFHKAIYKIGVLLLLPILIWWINRGDKKEQDRVDDIIMRGKGGKRPWHPGE